MAAAAIPATIHAASPGACISKAKDPKPLCRASVSVRPPSLGSVFGARPISARVKAMATYKVTVQTPHGVQTMKAPDDVYLLDSLEAAGLVLPYSCRAGACSRCVAKLVEGTVDQSDGSFLDEDQLAAGFVLPCVAYPTSDLVLKTDAEEDFHG